MLNKVITMRKKQTYSEEDYIMLLHESAHAIDFAWNKSEITINAKVLGTLGAIITYIFSIGSVSLLSLEMGKIFGFIFLLVFICCSLLDITMTWKIEYDADKILIEDLLDGRYKSVIKLAEVVQILNKVFIFCFFLFLFLLYQANIHLAY